MYLQVSQCCSTERSLFRSLYQGLCLFITLLFLGSVAAGQINIGKQAEEARLLEKGRPVEKEISGSEIHSYKLQLNSGQFLRIVVEQRGIDLIALVFNPNGEQVIEASTMNRQQGPKLIYLVAETTGNYRLEVRPAEKEVAPGKYEIKIEELRPATPQDRNQAAARKAFAEGERLRAQASKETLLKALEKYEAVLPHWRAIGDREGEAATLNSIGSICFSFGENQRGLEYLAQALKLWRVVGNRYWEVATLNSMGNAYNLLGENQKALDYYSQALLLINAVGDRRGEAVTLNGIGKVYADLGENQRALDYYTQALLLRRSTGDKRGEAITLHNMGNIYDNILEDKRALEYYDQAIAIFRTVNDQRGEASALNNSARIYVDIGEYQKALDYFGQTIKLKQVIGDKRGEATAINNIGYIYVLMSEKRESSSFIGSAYSLSTNKQQALNYLNQALQMWRSVGDPQEESATLTVISKIYASQGEFQKSRDYSTQAQTLKQNIDNRTASRRSEMPTLPAVQPSPSSSQTSDPGGAAQKSENEGDTKATEATTTAQETPKTDTTDKELARPRFTQQKPQSRTADSIKEGEKTAKKEKVERAEKTEKTEKPEKPEVAVKPSTTLSSGQTGKGKYVIQVGASPDKVLAEGLRERLRGAGLEGYIVEVNLPGKGTFYRVRAGKFENPDEAKRAATNLKAKGLIQDFFITTEN